MGSRYPKLVRRLFSYVDRLVTSISQDESITGRLIATLIFVRVFMHAGYMLTAIALNRSSCRLLIGQMITSRLHVGDKS